MRRSTLALLALSLLALPTAACAPKRPVLYPNAHLREAGAEAAQRDVDECLVLAASSGYEREPGRTVAGSTAGGAVGGAAVGTAVGAVLGNAGRGAGAGAAAGATRGLLRGGRAARNPDPIQRRFVEECLLERGYKPIGWR
jgi:hypothetical protein